MGSIIEKITEFIKEMLQGWVLDNLETMFTDVNTKVGTIAGEVGQTPSSWNAGIFSMIVFAFTVSIDSFSIGLALSIVENNLNAAFLIFSITSAIFTLLGLLLGKYLSKKLGKKATYFGIIILVLLAIKYLIN